jgi:DNA-binding transcriptional LysR family regulator
MSTNTRPTGLRESSWALGLELRQLQAFVVLLDAGSLSAAARILGVAQSTMSEAVAALERALGTRIVVRKRGGHAIALTPAGEALLPHARTVLASLEDAHVAVASVDRDMRARVEVIANESVSTYLLPPALSEVRKQWPNVRFSVTVGICPRITDGLSTARYDLGLMLQTDRASSDTVARAPTHSSTVSLAAIPLVLFASASHPLARSGGTPVLRERLGRSTIFVSDSRGYFFDMVRGFFLADGVPNVRLEATGSVEAVRQSVLTDRLALGVLPLYAVTEDIRSGRLRPILLRPALPRVQLQAALYRVRSPAHPAVAGLLEAIRQSVSRRSESEQNHTKKLARI